MNPRKKQIMEVAHRLFLKKGFTNTSVQDILDDAKIAKGTFYNHFSSKNECLIAILDHVNAEALIARDKLAIGQAKNDKNVFVKQIFVRMKINREENMLALYESVYHSKDNDLRTHLQQQRIASLQWISKRLIDLFGSEIKQHALDYASIFLGIIQHSMHVWMLGTKTTYDLEEIIRFSLKNLEIIIQHQKDLGEPLFSPDWLTIHGDHTNADVPLKEQIMTKLNNLHNHMVSEEINKKKIEYIAFLIMELQSDSPREFLLESVAQSLKYVFSTTIYNEDVHELSTLIKKYMIHQHT